MPASMQIGIALQQAFSIKTIKSKNSDKDFKLLLPNLSYNIKILPKINYIWGNFS
jgi:hypothetical protein